LEGALLLLLVVVVVVLQGARNAWWGYVECNGCCGGPRGKQCAVLGRRKGGRWGIYYGDEAAGSGGEASHGTRGGASLRAGREVDAQEKVSQSVRAVVTIHLETRFKEGGQRGKHCGSKERGGSGVSSMIRTQARSGPSKDGGGATRNSTLAKRTWKNHPSNLNSTHIFLGSRGGERLLGATRARNPGTRSPLLLFM